MPADAAVAEAASRTTEAVHAHGFSDGLDAGLSLGSRLALEWALTLGLTAGQEQQVRDRLAVVEEARV